MDNDAKLFLDFVDNLVDYSPKDFDEGFGTYYERFMMNRYLNKIGEKFNIKSVFEGPSDGITGIRGINSYPLVKSGAKLVYFTPSKKEKYLVGEVWDKIKQIKQDIKMNVDIATGEPLKYPFEDNTFDLAWNFCIMEHFHDPDKLIKEMKRISSRHILIMTQNVFNFGTIPHVIYHKSKNKAWDHGNLKWMKLSSVVNLLKENGLRIIETGVIDVPIWPDTWDVPIRGFFKKGVKTIGKTWRWNSLDDIDMKNELPIITISAIFERLLLPKIFKLPLAHHLYVLSEKGK